MKLVYWCCASLRDSPAYSIRTRTRREATAERAKLGEHAKDYGTPVKITVEYRDAFDLVTQALGEGGIYEPTE
jgi:hypothetical protein